MAVTKQSFGGWLEKEACRNLIFSLLQVLLGLPLSLFKNFPGAAGKVGFSKAMSAGWITLDKAAKPPLVKRKVSAIEDTVQVLSFKISSCCALYPPKS